MNDGKFPVKGYCFLINNNGDDCVDDTTAVLSRDIEKLVKYCCNKNIPHNIFFTYGSHDDEIRVFFFVRTTEYLGAEKIYGDFLIIAFCEFSGYFPVGRHELYDDVSEEFIVENINKQVGNVFDETEKDAVELFKEELL